MYSHQLLSDPFEISNKLRCDFPPGLSGIKNGAPISHKWAEAGVVVLLRCAIMGSSVSPT